MKTRVAFSALVAVANFVVVLIVYRLTHFHPDAVRHVDLLYGLLFGAINSAVFLVVWPAAKASSTSN